jgi:dGTPase
MASMYVPSDWQRRKPVTSSEDYRSEARRDAARLIHCAAFRRLQGKTQLFPGIESDFFRNRLTHSLEVGQIAKSIAYRLNGTEEFLKPPEMKIDPDLAELAGWCHDLGHPPFGHNGETALDELLREHGGGFEGNAQTLRILGTLEKRDYTGNHPSGISDEKDTRLGLNLAARTLAAILKYDQKIPRDEADRQKPDSVMKGYYSDDEELVAWMKSNVLTGRTSTSPFKTVECQIMDLADDIAYSTYDLEDALHAEFLNPLDIIAAPKEVIEAVASRVAKSIGETFTASDVLDVLKVIFGDFGANDEGGQEEGALAAIIEAHAASRNLATDGYLRVRFTSELIGRYIQAVTFKPDESVPALSKIELKPTIRAQVEVLKNLSYVRLIMKPRLKLAEYRGELILKEMFTTLKEEKGSLLPDDFRAVYDRLPASKRDRVICDFIAGMTDRYASEFHGRLRSESPQSIFKPI